MENQNFKITINTILALVFLCFITTTIGLIAKICHWPFASHIYTIGFAMFIPVWFIVLTDIIKNKVYNKAFWLISLFLMPMVAVIFYLSRRKKIVKFD